MKPGSVLMIGLQGLSLSKQEKHFLISEEIAGVILFKRNIQDFKQLFELCQELKSLNLLIGIDMEGGLVDRLKHIPDAWPWPSAEELVKKNPEEIFCVGMALGQHLRALNIDINFAPVLDISRVESSVLKTRTYGKTAKQVCFFALPFLQGLKQAGVHACLKHFPGHGAVREDSHKELPEDDRDLENLDIKPFEVFIEAPLIMTAHIKYPKVCSLPATLSPRFLQDVLRKKLQFKGVIVSDDIDMHALKNFPKPEIYLQALKAGCNLILCCEDIRTPRDILNYFQSKPEACQNIQDFVESSKTRLELIKRPILFSSYKQAHSSLFSEEIRQALKIF